MGRPVRNYVLTDEQRELVSEYITLADKAADITVSKWPMLDIDAIRSAARYGLCTAAVNYDGEKGKFGTFAYGKIQFAIKDEFRVRSRRKYYSIEKQMLSLDLVTGEGDPLSDIVQSRDDDIDTHIMIEEVVQKLPPQLRMVIRNRLSGYTFEEIGNQGGYTKEWARQLYEKALRAIRKYISREDVA